MLAAAPSEIVAIRHALSEPRIGTYITAMRGDASRAIELYGWNARVSASLLLPAHFAEVTTRNAVSDALTAIYGAGWPWSSGFARALPAPQRGFNPRRDLVTARDRHSSTGKVIAELKFVFWQKMFTARHDAGIWNSQLLGAFPGSSATTVATLRNRIYADLEAIRQLRNRIAHHEPIITRNLADDLTRIVDLIQLRCRQTASWVTVMEDVTATLAERPQGP